MSRGGLASRITICVHADVARLLATVQRAVAAHARHHGELDSRGSSTKRFATIRQSSLSAIHPASRRGELGGNHPRPPRPDRIKSQRLPNILPPVLSDDPQSLALLLASHGFGHPVRLDYGSGHELSFVLVLNRLVRSGTLARWSRRKGKERATEGVEAEEAETIALAEDDLVLRVFPR